MRSKRLYGKRFTVVGKQVRAPQQLSLSLRRHMGRAYKLQAQSYEEAGITRPAGTLFREEGLCEEAAKRAPITDH